MIRRAFGNALRDVRELLGVSQPNLARKGNFGQGQLSKMERGKVDPGLIMIQRLSRALNVDIDAFWTEILHHMAQLGLTDHREIKITSEMLDGGILSVSAVSRIDIQSNTRFIEQIFSMAKERSAHKILMDLSLCLCHFSEEDQYRGARHGIQWMQDNSFRPIIAVVANSTLNQLGASIIREEANHRVEIFSEKPDAQNWLRQQQIMP